MNQKLIDKIKKLLALSSSPIKAESELALQRAKELMEQYGIISLTDDKKEAIVERLYEYPAGKLNRDFQYNLVSIASSISQMFNCIVLIRADKPCVIGLETNVEVAFHALDCILHSLWYDYRVARRANPSLAFSTSFWEGASEGIRTKFRPCESNPRSQTGLVIYDQVNEYIREKYPKLGAWSAHQNTTNAKQGFSAGQSAGAAAQIRPGVTTGNTGRLLN